MLPLDYAIRNLGRSPSRLIMTVLGSALLVAAVLAAGAFVRGMDESLRATGSPDNVILLGAGSEEAIERSEISASVPGIVAASVDGIREQAGVAFVSPEVHAMLHARPADAPWSSRAPAPVTVRGVTQTALLVHRDARIVDGHFPRVGHDEVMVGRAASVRMGVPDAALAVGRMIEIDGRPWTICGRFSAGGTMAEAEIWTAMADLMEATRRSGVSCVVLTLDTDEQVGAEFEDIAVFTMLRPDLELVAILESEYYAQLSAFFDPIRVVVWTTAGLILVGGFLGGLNTMYAAFVSRVREFGTLQAIGFRRRAIALSLVQESVVATAAGTLLACAVGVLLLDGLSIRFSQGAFGLIVDAPVILAGLVAGLSLGLFGALPPALRCLRLPIPTALKAV